jgi:cell shape-determining protein MreC
LLSRDNNLIGVRSRATMNRPFTRVKKMEAQADARFRGKVQELEASLAETQRRLNELQQNKDKNQRFESVLSARQIEPPARQHRPTFT